jgi:ech hydrogenase subunit A
MLIGGASFIITAFIAISCSNARKAPTYSTISNLGLLGACADINSAAMVWSALLLIN